MRILLLTLVFSPDSVSTSVLMTELALELKKLGHELTVLTTTPHYNVEPEARQRQPLRRRWGGLLFEQRGGTVGDGQLGWDGRVGERQVNPGVSVWKLTLEYLDGIEETFAGDVTLLR